MTRIVSKQTRVLVAKTHVMGIREGEHSVLQRCWMHGHSLSKQTQVLVAKTHVLGMLEGASLYASEVLDAWSQCVKSKHKCWWQRHMSWACERESKSLCFRGVGRMVTVCQKQTQVLMAKTHVMGMRDTSFYASEMNSMVKSDNRSCLMAIPVFFYKSRRLQNRG